jgi:hypothetical protein
MESVSPNPNVTEIGIQKKPPIFELGRADK